MCGNLTIRVAPDGTCSILLPAALRYLSDTPGKKHLTLSAKVIFRYRETDWQAQLARSGALAYERRRSASPRTDRRRGPR